MPIDFNYLKQKLNALNEQTASRQKKPSSTQLFWSPQTTHVIRIVPYPHDLSDPFRELYFYYNFQREGKQGPITSPVSYGQPDPVFEFAKKLQARGGSTEDYKMGKRLEPVRRPHVLMVERGREEEGFKFWGFSDAVYKELLDIMLDPDFGDITDVFNGRDITVTKTAAPDGGYPKTTIRVKPNVTPLSDSPTVLEALKNVPRVEDIYVAPTYDELTAILEDYLSTADTGTASKPATAPAAKAPETTPQPSISAGFKASTPTAAADAFEELFKRG